jgi:hypothetical protein
MNKVVKIGCFILFALVVAGCLLLPQPRATRNICDIFRQYPEWYWDARATEQKWGVPVPVQMAIIYQESGFQAGAQPPARERLLNLIPWRRQSTALGYCQALEGTWRCYEASTGKELSRDQFAAASDFIGWYANMAKKQAHIQPTDAFNLYLSYHEGLGGFHAKSFWRKPWLIHVARRVQSLSKLYESQLKECAGQIPKPQVTQSNLNSVIQNSSLE